MWISSGPAVQAANALARLEGAHRDVCALQNYLLQEQRLGNSPSSGVVWRAAHGWVDRLRSSRLRVALLDLTDAPPRLLHPCVVLGEQEGSRVIDIVGTLCERTGVVQDRDWRWTPGQLAGVRAWIALEALSEAGVPQSANRFLVRRHPSGLRSLLGGYGGVVVDVDAMPEAIGHLQGVRDTAWDLYTNFISAVGGHLPGVAEVLGEAMPWSVPGALRFSTADMLNKVQRLDSNRGLQDAIRVQQFLALPHFLAHMSGRDMS